MCCFCHDTRCVAHLHICCCCFHGAPPRQLRPFWPATLRPLRPTALRVLLRHFRAPCCIIPAVLKQFCHLGQDMPWPTLLKRASPPFARALIDILQSTDHCVSYFAISRWTSSNHASYYGVETKPIICIFGCPSTETVLRSVFLAIHYSIASRTP